MANYALINEVNIVVDIITGIDETELIEGLEPETWYSNFTGKKCRRTSYNTKGNQHLNGGTPFRGNYAGIGYTYHNEFDVFIPPQPYPSWKLDYSTFTWEAPVEYPGDMDNVYAWSEINKEWIKL
jgi:hypothetical protein